MEFDAIMNYLSDISREEIFVNIRYHQYVIECEQEFQKPKSRISTEDHHLYGNEETPDSNNAHINLISEERQRDSSILGAFNTKQNCDGGEQLLTGKYKNYRQDFEFLNNFKSNVNKISLSSELLEHLNTKYQGLRTKVSKKARKT